MVKTQCHQCGGSGKIFLRPNAKKIAFINCDMCEGSEECVGNLLWEIQGALIKDFRIKTGMSLREFAINCDIDPSNFSKMERGIMKPDWTILKLMFR